MGGGEDFTCFASFFLADEGVDIGTEAFDVEALTLVSTAGEVCGARDDGGSGEEFLAFFSTVEGVGEVFVETISLFAGDGNETADNVDTGGDFCVSVTTGWGEDFPTEAIATGDFCVGDEIGPFVPTDLGKTFVAEAAGEKLETLFTAD